MMLTVIWRGCCPETKIQQQSWCNKYSRGCIILVRIQLGQQLPRDPAVQRIFQKHALVPILGGIQASVAEVELDEVSLG